MNLPTGNNVETAVGIAMAEAAAEGAGTDVRDMHRYRPSHTTATTLPLQIPLRLQAIRRQ